MYFTTYERRVLNLVPKHSRKKVKRFHSKLSHKKKEEHLEQIWEAFGDYEPPNKPYVKPRG